MVELAFALHSIKHKVTAPDESPYLLFVTNVPDRHYPLTAVPPSSPTYRPDDGGNKHL
jgi:hypothetical protein